MDNLSHLETYAQEVAAAAKLLADQCRASSIGQSMSSSSLPAHLTIPLDAPDEVHQTRRKLVFTMARLQTFLAQPADFLHHLASQNQLIACLHWLGEFQILACIPLTGSVATVDIADLAGVPEMQLRRIVRMTTLAGFLQEPQPGYVAHTALSAPFVTRRSYLDAAMFLADTAAPAALHMVAATRRHGHSDPDRPAESPYNVAFGTARHFRSACAEQGKLQHQWPAYLACVGGMDHGAVELLSQLDWLSLGEARVVDVGAPSTDHVLALAKLNPLLRFVVQMSMSEPIARPGRPSNGNVVVQKRALGEVQTVTDASVYMVRISSAPGSIRPPITALVDRILQELRAHLGVLRANSSATLILAPRLLPDPGSVDPSIESVARLRDLSLLQLGNDRELEIGELVDLIASVYDDAGRLMVVKTLRSPNSAAVALGIKYQAYADRQQELPWFP